MRYGICTDLENAGLLEEMGYDYIEPSINAALNLEPERLEQLVEELKTLKIRCEAFNILFPKTMELLKDTDEAELTAHLHRAMGLMQRLGGRVVVFGSGKCRRCPESLSYGEAYKRLVKIYRMTGEIAAQYGIMVVIEPLSRAETNMICTMAEGAILEADVNHPNVALLSDYFHVMANHDNIQDIETIKNFGHIHIASGNGRRYPISEEGEAYGAYIKSLKNAGYQGRISIEGKTDDILRDGPKALAFLKELEDREYE